MDLTPFPELTTEQQRAIKEYTRNQVTEKLDDAHRTQQEATHLRPKPTRKGEEPKPRNKVPEVKATYQPISLWKG